MRSYPRNSPEAAARILALVLIADGHVCATEFAALQRLDAAETLGLAPDALPRVVHTLCEDLLVAAYGSGSLMASVDEDMLKSLMAEIDDPALQRQVMALAASAAAADLHLSEGETIVLDAARRHWRLQEPAPVA